MLKTVTNSINASQIQTPITLPGNVTLSTGNLVIGTAGNGIDFSVNPAAPGVTSELLNDYETGTWNGGISFGGASTGITYANFLGYYTKIGNVVTVSAYINISSKGSATGAARITGLPFTCVNDTAAYAAPAFFFSNLTFSGQVTGYVNVGDTTIDILQTTVLGTSSALNDTNFAIATAFIVGLTYRAA
jgi:hypothetical protein